MPTLMGSVTQTVYDRLLRKRDSYDELYRGWYAEYLQQLEKYGRRGIEGGGGDNWLDDEEGPWAEKIYVDLHELLEQILAGMDGEKLDLLEIGAGSGYLSCRLAGPDRRAHLIDKEPLSIDVSRRVAELMDKDAYATAECHDVFEFVPDRSYDLVFSLGLFEELDDAQRERYLKLTRGFVKPGGVQLIGVPNFASPVMVKLWHQHGKGNEVFLSRSRMRKLLSDAGFVDVHTKAAGSVIPRQGDYWADHRLAPWLGMMNVVWGRRA